MEEDDSCGELKPDARQQQQPGCRAACVFFSATTAGVQESMQQRLLEESVCEWVASDLQLLMDMKGTDVAPTPPSTQKIIIKKKRYGNTSPLSGP